jgi:hypothetical protein
MATVRLSGELTEEIIKAANGLFAKRVSEVEGMNPRVTTEAHLILDAYLDAKPGRREALAAVTQQGWTVSNQTMELHMPDVANGARLAFPSSRHLLFAWTPNYGTPGLRIKQQDVDASPYLKALQAECVAREKRKAELYEERKVFTEMVKKVLKNSTTLKQALSLWPGLWDLVPQEAKDRHNMVTERSSTRVEAARELIDIESLNVGLVTSKIVEGAL